MLETSNNIKVYNSNKEELVYQRVKLTVDDIILVEKIEKNSHIYHLFLLLSTFTRGLVETFSLVLLYKKGCGLL